MKLFQLVQSKIDPKLAKKPLNRGPFYLGLSIYCGFSILKGYSKKLKKTSFFNLFSVWTKIGWYLTPQRMCLAWFRYSSLAGSGGGGKPAKDNKTRCASLVDICRLCAQCIRQTVRLFCRMYPLRRTRNISFCATTQVARVKERIMGAYTTAGEFGRLSEALSSANWNR